MPSANDLDAQTFHNRTKYVLADTGSGDTGILMGVPPEFGPAMGEQNPELEPSPYKIYPHLQPILLPKERIVTDVRALEALAATGPLGIEDAIPDLAKLSQVMFRTSGLLKEWTTPWGKTVAFRAAGCTGARYHLETYIVCGNLDGLAAGVYHYSPQDHSLRQLRSGDHRAALIEATGAESAISLAPVVVLISSEFWRNAWRYQERAYRHAYWDLGTQLTNLISVGASVDLPTDVVLGFADEPVNRLVGIDGEREAVLGLVALGRQATPPQPVAIDSTSKLLFEVEPSSLREIAFSAIQAVHLASSLPDGKDAVHWRAQPLTREMPAPTGPVTVLEPLDPADIPDETIEDVIVRRRSNRHYAADVPLSFDAFSTVLETANRRVAIDALDPESSPPADLYLIVNNVEGLEQGVYVHHPDRNAVEMLRAGDFRADAQRLACGQGYAADVHVNCYLLSDLDQVIERYGDRGYRLAQFEAALTGGRLQLAAHALRLGAVGSTSADDDVTAFFSPHAAGKSFMFVAVFGKRRRPSDKESADSSRYLNRDKA